MERIEHALRLAIECIHAELSAEAMVVFVTKLMSHDLVKVVSALDVCSTELKGNISLKDIFDRMGVTPVKELVQAEAVADWDFVLNIVRRHLQKKPDGDGDECYEFCSHTRFAWEQYPAVRREDLAGLKEAHCAATGRNEIPVSWVPCPPIPKRVEDAVSRMGGWPRLARMRPEDVTWAQKEFIAQYEVWPAVEQVQRASLTEGHSLPAPAAEPKVGAELPGAMVHQLAQDKEMDKPAPLKPKSRHTRAQLKAQLEGLQCRSPKIAVDRCG